MISSEVQRTLVKSPPELWSELSDPESLARHLGELGEIEITRVEPENLVEWEAEGTTGTVQIKPSGWGTRVTLTVSRELPAGEGARPAGDEAPGEAEAEGPAAAAPTEARAERPAEPGEPPAATAPVAEEAPQRTPAPATEAARRAAGWPSSVHEPGAAIESEPHSAEAFGAPAEPDGLQAWAVQAAIEPPERVEHDEPVPAPEPEPAAEPRRGFLARLFGRRRKPATLVDSAPVEPLALSDSEEDAPHLPESSAPIADAEEPADQGLELLDPLDEPIADAAQPAEEPDLAEEETEPIGAPAPEPATATLAGVAADDCPAADLSAELKAAEEVAAERVTAVLTAVLDRLGSAHHRPFSRA